MRIERNNLTFLGGLFSVILLSIVLFVIIVGEKPFFNMATNFTAPGGDALKDFYNTYYHVANDTTILQNNSMNYPYGEHYTYTGTQIYISAILRILKHCNINGSQYVLFLINLCIFCSIILCAIFLYLLFQELKVSTALSIIGALAITFLSPQIDRINSHLTLSYSFIIPCAIYLFYKWYENSKWFYSIAIAILTLLSGLFHPYYIFFIVAIWGMTGLVTLFQEKTFQQRVLTIVHLCLQFIVPFCIFMILTRINDDPSDRTAIPWGFYAYKGKLEGIFLPAGRTFCPIHIEWEAYSFIGSIALIIFLIGIIQVLKKLYQKNYSSVLAITNNTYINILFWASVILTIYALGIPFIWFPEDWFNYYGPLAQLRAVGRFQWLFYYTINCIAIFSINTFLADKNKTTQYAILLIVILLYSFDIYEFNKKRNCTNDLELFTDYSNTKKQNEWVHNFDASQYQSILPLPFFSIGTEHIWYNVKDDMFKKAAYVSIKTGLPMHGLYSSRSKINQAYDNLSFAFEPYNEYPVLNKMDNQKKILIITPHSNNSLNTNEQRIVRYATFLFTANDIDFYDITTTKLHQIHIDFCSEMNAASDSCMTSHANNCFTNTYSDYYFNDFEQNFNTKSFKSKGALSCNLSHWTVLYDSLCPIQASQIDTVELSFLLSNYKDDLIGRTKIEITKGNEVKTYNAFQLYANQFDDWGLLRTTLSNIDSTTRIRIAIRNTTVKKNTTISIDNLLMRTLQTNVTYKNDSITLFNNSLLKTK